MKLALSSRILLAICGSPLIGHGSPALAQPSASPQITVPGRAQRAYRGWVSAVGFSPDGRMVVSGGGWSRYERTLDPDENDAPGPDLDILAERTFGEITLWDVASKEEDWAQCNFTERDDCVAFSPDGKWLVSGGESGSEIKLRQGPDHRLAKTIAALPGGVWSLAFSPNGKMLVSGSTGGQIGVWNLDNGGLRQIKVPGYEIADAVQFSPDGKTIAIGLSTGNDPRSTPGAVWLWNLVAGQKRRVLGDFAGAVSSLMFSPDGQTLVTGHGDNTVRLWNTATWKLKQTLTGHTDRVTAVAFAPDGKSIASASNDQSVKVWNPRTGALLETLTGQTVGLTCVAYSPDSQMIVAGSWDGQVKVWHLGQKYPRIIEF